MSDVTTSRVILHLIDKHKYTDAKIGEAIGNLDRSLVNRAKNQNQPLASDRKRMLFELLLEVTQMKAAVNTSLANGSYVDEAAELVMISAELFQANERGDAPDAVLHQVPRLRAVADRIEGEGFAHLTRADRPTHRKARANWRASWPTASGDGHTASLSVPLSPSPLTSAR